MFSANRIIFTTALLTLLSGIALGNNLPQTASLLIPEPRRVELGEADGEPFALTPWTQVVVDPPVAEAGRIAAELVRDWLTGLVGDVPEIEAAPERAGVIFLRVEAGLDDVGPEGYRITVAPYGVRITGVDPAGLYYGAATLIRLIPERSDDSIGLPGLSITDWPDLPLRAIHYDLKHHQDRFDSLKKIINRLSLYKINGFVLELEDKFAFPRHPEIGAPGALTPDRLRALWNYAADRHVELIPLVQGLGHVSHILKHPQHYGLREVDNSPWQICPYRPDALGLLTDLYQDVLDVLPGGGYFHIGGDESYELGQCPECREIKEATGVGTIYLDWMLPAVEYLADRGRRVMVWDDMVLQFGEETIKRLPDDIVFCRWSYNTRTVQRPRLFQLGFPVLVCPAVQCVTPLFPDYENRIQNIAGYIPAGKKLGAVGSMTTSWDDSGLHQETFWYGFACAAEYSWTCDKPALDSYRAKFIRHFYGPENNNMAFVYDVLGQTGDLWSIMRGGPFWYRDRWRDAGAPIPLPPLPTDSLTVSGNWLSDHAVNVNLARDRQTLLEQVIDVLDEAGRAREAYNIRVLHSVAAYASYSAWAVLTLARIDLLYGDARTADTGGDSLAALGKLEDALKQVRELEREGRFALNDLVTVWEESRLPKGMSADGREYLHMTDFASHLANVTPGMSYLRLVEESWNLDAYAQQLENLIRNYRLRNNLP
jgi:hypothetical protein